MSNICQGFNKNNKVPDCSISSSLPTKYPPPTRNEKKKGFSSQAKRFPSQFCLNENPGPGSYDCISSVEIKSPSFSKKGTTGFVPASKVARPSIDSPGPNAYTLPGCFMNENDFNIGVSRVFRLPVAVQVDGPKHTTPAPNQYDVQYDSRERNFSMVVGTSPFLSKTGRNSYFFNKKGPSPCHYEVNTILLHNAPKAVMSPFKSKSQRILPILDNCVPGPGSYNPHQAPAPVKKTRLPRRYFLALSAPPLIVPKDPPLPGPGQYDLGNSEGLSKNPVPTAAFTSKTKRIPRNSQANMSPGPGFYDPQILSKQSFFYNDSRIWLPV